MAVPESSNPENPIQSDDEIWDLEATIVERKQAHGKGLIPGVKPGVCYLSRIPPQMDPTRLRHILSQFGEVNRIYLVPKDSKVHGQTNRDLPKRKMKSKQEGGRGFRGIRFTEGWVEFTKRSVAKNVANMLNGEQIGGKRGSSCYYDIWNIKYLSKFQWSDLTSETADSKHTRDQKMTMEITAAKRERDFYLKKVDESKALKFIQQRVNKKQKTEGDESNADTDNVPEPKVIRRFPQNRPIADQAAERKPRLSKDILAEVFGSSA